MKPNTSPTKTNSKHKKSVAGISDMKELAEMIGDLHYENLCELLLSLSKKFEKDATKDWNAGKANLSIALGKVALSIADAHYDMKTAWQISKPFMTDNKKAARK